MRIFEEVPIAELSREWLLDEHRTGHALWGLFKKQLVKNPDFRWNGYDQEFIKTRHKLIAEEMIKRGYQHKYNSDIDDDCPIVDRSKNKLDNSTDKC